MGLLGSRKLLEAAATFHQEVACTSARPLSSMLRRSTWATLTSDKTPAPIVAGSGQRVLLSPQLHAQNECRSPARDSVMHSGYYSFRNPPL